MELTPMWNRAQRHPMPPLTTGELTDEWDRLFLP